MPEFDLSNSISSFLESSEWGQLIRKWEGYVASVVESKGNPPQLF
jgi:hypothetical protein